LGDRFDDQTTLSAMPLVLRANAAWAHDWMSNPALMPRPDNSFLPSVETRVQLK
jgi:hypothetical protein